MLENYKKIPVKTIYMEMTENPEINFQLPANIEFSKIENIDIEEYKNIYHKVGDFWGWCGRLIISDEELKAILHNSQDEIYFMYIDGKIAGFCELFRHNYEDVELVYMGLIAEFIGKGYGKILLDFTKKTAWNKSTKRFWLHTCEYDGKNAVNSYQKAGFKIFKEQIDEEYYPIKFLK